RRGAAGHELQDEARERGDRGVLRQRLLEPDRSDRVVMRRWLERAGEADPVVALDEPGEPLTAVDDERTTLGGAGIRTDDEPGAALVTEVGQRSAADRVHVEDLAPLAGVTDAGGDQLVELGGRLEGLHPVLAALTLGELDAEEFEVTVGGKLGGARLDGWPGLGRA